MRSKIFVMVTLVMALPMLATAQSVIDDSCTTGEGGGSDRWAVDAEWIGSVDCGDASSGILSPDVAGECTAVRYTVNPNLASSGNRNIAHATVLAYNPPPYTAIDEFWTSSSSISVSARCDGDSATDSGIGSCHEQAIRVNANGDKSATWWVAVEGVRQWSKTTVTIKGQSEGRCTILGFGDEVEENILPDGCVPSCGNFDEEQTITKTEILDFKGCKARFEYNLATGSVLNFGAACDTGLFPTVDLGNCCAENPNDPFCASPSLPTTCDFPEYLADDGGVTVTLPFSSGPVPINFGDGLVSIGTDSCSCRVIGGRIYCWGQVCPE